LCILNSYLILNFKSTSNKYLLKETGGCCFNSSSCLISKHWQLFTADRQIINISTVFMPKAKFPNTDPFHFDREKILSSRLLDKFPFFCHDGYNSLKALLLLLCNLFLTILRRSFVEHLFSLLYFSLYEHFFYRDKVYDFLGSFNTGTTRLKARCLSLDVALK